MPSDNDKDKGNYDPIPDVEAGVARKDEEDEEPSISREAVTKQAKDQYPELELDDDQAKLMGTLDEAMKHTKLDLKLPTQATAAATMATVETWQAQAKDFVMGLLQPTITAIVTFGMAVYLEGQQRVQDVTVQGQERIDNTEEQLMSSDWTKYAIMLFPYVNATIVFCATVRPILKRCMMMVQPIFDSMDHAEAKLQKTVQTLGPFVDKTIDGIQKDFHIVLEPIKPSLDQISSKAQMLEKVLDNRGDDDEDLDIPDPSDIDRELDEAQGIVTNRIDEAQKELQVEKYVPSYLSSPRQFFWRVVFPIVVLAWLLQMAVAFTTEYMTHHNNDTQEAYITTIKRPPIEDRMLLLLDNPLSLDFIEADDNSRMLEAAANSPPLDLELGSIRDADYKSQMRDNVTHQMDDYKHQAHDQYNHYSEMANSTMHSLRDNATNMLHAYEEDFQDQYHHYKGELDSAIAQSKSLVQDVIWSYVMALIQMVLIYIITSKAVQAWVVRQGMRQVQKGAERTLEEYGVSAALEDVFGARLGRVRAKILKLLEIYKKVEHTLEDAGAMVGNFLPEGTADQVAETLSGDAVDEAMKKAKKSKFFGRMFKK